MVDGINNSKKALVSGLKAGLHKTDLGENTDNKMKSLFDIIDKDKNGVLDKEEINKFYNGDGETKGLNRNGDGKITRREAKKFLKAHQQELKNAGFTKKDMIEILNQFAADGENIEGMTGDSQKGYEVTYKDSENKRTIDKDGNYSNFDKDGNGETYDVNNTHLSSTKVDKENNTTTVTSYNNGEEESIDKVVTKKNDGSETTTVQYHDFGSGSEPTTKKVEKGSTVENYDIITDENGERTERILNKTIDKGNGVKEEHKYDYREDGSFTETVKDNAYPDNSTVYDCDKEGHHLSQSKTVGGNQYSVEYDGKGNTKVVLQKGETLEQLAKEFGCSVEDLKVLNGDNKIAYGDNVIVPKEFEADDDKIKNRKSSADVKSEVKAEEDAKEAERKHQAEIAERKRAIAKAQREAENAQLKPLGLKDRKGAGEKVDAHFGKTNRHVQLTKVGNAVNGRTICKDKSGKYYVVAHDGVILKEEYVKSTSLYAAGNKVDCVVKDKNGNKTNVKYAEVPGYKDKHGRTLVVDKNGKFYLRAHDGSLLKSDYVDRVERSDAIREDSAKAQEATFDLLDSQVASAEEAFNQQLKNDGWAGDVADGISILWGSKNRASEVRKDLAKLRSDIAECKLAAQNEGDAGFKAKFKEKFGIDYNQNAIADYVQNPSAENYRKAFGTKQPIGERVAEYNQSQQTGAAWVKTGAKFAAGAAAVAATVGTGGLAGIAIAGTATAAGSVAIDVSDRVSSEDGLKDGELTEAIKDGAIDGAITAATMGLSQVGQAAYRGIKTARAASKAANTTEKAVANSSKALPKTTTTAAEKGLPAPKPTSNAPAPKPTPNIPALKPQGVITESVSVVEGTAVTGAAAEVTAMERAAVDFAANTVVGVGAEYAMTGDITLEGTAMNMVMGSIGIVGTKIGNFRAGRALSKAEHNADANSSTKQIFNQLEENGFKAVETVKAKDGFSRKFTNDKGESFDFITDKDGNILRAEHTYSEPIKGAQRDEFLNNISEQGFKVEKSITAKDGSNRSTFVNEKGERIEITLDKDGNITKMSTDNNVKSAKATEAKSAADEAKASEEAKQNIKDDANSVKDSEIPKEHRSTWQACKQTMNEILDMLSVPNFSDNLTQIVSKMKALKSNMSRMYANMEAKVKAKFESMMQKLEKFYNEKVSAESEYSRMRDAKINASKAKFNPNAKTEPLPRNGETLKAKGQYEIKMDDLPTLELCEGSVIDLREYSGYFAGLKEGDSIILGRGKDAHIDISDKLMDGKYVSGHHVMITKHNGKLIMQDISKNGNTRVFTEAGSHRSGRADFRNSQNAGRSNRAKSSTEGAPFTEAQGERMMQMGKELNNVRTFKELDAIAKELDSMPDCAMKRNLQNKIKSIRDNFNRYGEPKAKGTKTEEKTGAGDRTDGSQKVNAGEKAGTKTETPKEPNYAEMSNGDLNTAIQDLKDNILDIHKAKQMATEFTEITDKRALTKFVAKFGNLKDASAERSITQRKANELKELIDNNAPIEEIRAKSAELKESLTTYANSDTSAFEQQLTKATKFYGEANAKVVNSQIENLAEGAKKVLTMDGGLRFAENTKAPDLVFTRKNGKVILENVGNREVVIDGKKISKGVSIELNENSVVKIDDLEMNIKAKSKGE